MNKKLKLLALIMSASVVTSVMVGCTKTKKTAANDENQPPKDLKFTMWVRNFGNGEIANMSEQAGIQEFEKKTGIKIEFTHPAAGINENEQLNLIIASNQLPDLIFARWDSMPGGLSKYIASKTIIPLNSYIDKYAPNYKKTLEKYPNAKKQAQFDDGTIPGMYVVNGFTSITSGFVIRQDWLNKLNLKAPTTLDEWHNTLKAIKDGDPNGNGKKDEIPWGEYKDSNMWQRFASSFGFVDGIYKDASTGKVSFGPLNPNYKTFITTMSQWYKEGLFDSEFASSDKKGYEAKLMGDTTGASYISVGNMAVYKAGSKTPTYALQPIANPKASDGKTYSISDTTLAVGSYLFTVTNACKYPAEAVKAFDYGYTDEGGTLLNWGIEGQSYQVVNGKKQFTDNITKNPDGKSVVTAINRYAFPIYGATPKIMDFEPYSLINLVSTEQKLSNELWTNPNEIGVFVPTLQFTADESSNIANIMNDLGTYKNEMELKFILGAEPLSNIDNYISRLKAMRLQEAVDIYQKAYDRYQARK
jgi:putative aldouronate transport system substrate-binding protein